MTEEQKDRLLQAVKLIAAALGADLKPDADLAAQSMHGTAYLLGRMTRTPEAAAAIGRAAGQYTAEARGAG